eukprot:TRINITY_DN9451_c0_g2_i1.p1 TRINITY_DN9451_c0_g2~~TRINITY_DN9451_c0_g2_i1.p1  ORF type:complete len:556 (-),score=105.16 TRINITY_DN9451_c0_g2_i1:287-1954(-)
MDLHSPDKVLEESGDLQRDDSSAFVGKLDLNLAASKDEEGDGGYSHGNAERGDKIQVDLNQLEEHQRSPMLADISFQGPKSLSAKPNTGSPSASPNLTHSLHPVREIGEPALLVRTESYHDDMERGHSDYDPERYHSKLKDNHFGGETGVASGKLSSALPAETFHDEMKHGDPSRYIKPTSTDETGRETENSKICNGKLSDDTAKENSGNFHRKLGFEKIESVYEEAEGVKSDHHEGKCQNSARMMHFGDEIKADISHSGKLSDNREMEGENFALPSPGRTPKRSASPVRKMSVSPKKSPQQKPPSQGKGVQGSSYSPRSLRQKRSHSPVRHGRDGKRAASRDRLSPSTRKLSDSPGKSSRQDSQCRDESPRKRSSGSPRRRYSPPSHRGRDRSASRSPVRRRDSLSGYRRDYRNRSRSRSPYSRDRYRRSPRRRYSPRRRSPPTVYHSRRRSPRRRPWSPPPNRITGVGRPGKNLFVAGFGFITTERDLERKFSRFGRVTDVRIVRDRRTGDSRGFGFLSLERDEDADAAIRALDQTEWNGRVVLVEKSKTPAH